MSNHSIAAYAKCQAALIVAAIIIIGLPYPSAGEVRINSNVLLNDGNQAFLKSDYKKAFTLLKKACDLGNNDACRQIQPDGTTYDEHDYYLWRAFHKVRNKEYDEAIKLDTLAIKLRPKGTGYISRAETYCASKQYDKALSDANNYINNEGIQGYVLRAYVYYRKGDSANAIKDLHKVGKIGKTQEYVSANRDSLGIIFKELDDIYK